MSNKLLTIGIPTYNRAFELDNSLSVLLPQIKPFKNYIRLVVSDNASTQDNKTIIDKYIAKGYEIEFVLHAINLGMDGNFSFLYENASSKYVWMLSDDDLLAKNGIETIINILLSKENFGSVYLSNMWYDVNDKHINIPKLLEYRHHSVDFYDDGLKYFEKINYWVTFLSAHIVNKEMLKDKVDIKRFQGTHLALLSWIIPAMFQNIPNAIINGSVLVCKGNNQGGYRLVEVFAKNFNVILDYFIKIGYPKQIKSVINRKLLREYFIHFILSGKEQKLTATSYAKEDWSLALITQYYGNFDFYLYTLPAIILSRENYTKLLASKLHNFVSRKN